MEQAPREQRRALVETAPRELSIRRCCELLNINRSTLYYDAKPAEFDDVDLLNRIRDIWERYPFYGYRRITKELRPNHTLLVNRKACTAFDARGWSASDLSRAEHEQAK